MGIAVLILSAPPYSPVPGISQFGKRCMCRICGGAGSGHASTLTRALSRYARPKTRTESQNDTASSRSTPEPPHQQWLTHSQPQGKPPTTLGAQTPATQLSFPTSPSSPPLPAPSVPTHRPKAGQRDSGTAELPNQWARPLMSGEGIARDGRVL